MGKICFVGLGNPGEKYKNTRHNAGFICLDYIHNHFNFSDFKSFKSDMNYSRGNILENTIYLLKPMSYMNNSGIPLKRFCDYNGITFKDIIVIYDDIDTEIGSIRIRKKGSDGGHNGMGSIIESFKTQDIKRIRIGIGPKKDDIELSNYVLSNFSKQELVKFDNALKKIPDIVMSILKKGIDDAISRFN